MKPRVAIVAHDARGDQGSERVIKELVRRAQDRIDFIVVSRNLDDGLRPLVTWRRAPAPGAPYKLKFLAYFVTGALQLLRARADLVHVHAIGPTVPNRADLTSVHLFRAGLYESFGIRSPSPGTRFHLALERWCYGRSRMLAAFSPGHQRELEGHFPGVPVVLTPNAVDLDRFRPDAEERRAMRAAEGIDDEEVVALFVANAWRQRGLPAVIEALRHAPGIRLWVVGYGDAERYATLARGHNVADRIRFFGQQRHVERFYRAADLFVFPTSYETFCLAAYEAAACGLPVVATRVSGIEDLVGEDEAGIVVEATAESVSAALVRLAADAALRARMGEAALERARAYTWERSVESVLEAYEQLLA